MQFYVNTIEQIVDSEGNYSEYSKSEKVADFNSALSKFYKKLSDVSADIDKNHTYMHIQIVNSEGFVNKTEIIGTYVKG